MLTFRPLVAWPGPQRASYQRTRSQFDTPWNKTLDLLDRELDKLHVRAAVMQVALPESEFTRDGAVRSSARKPAMPGVVLTFVKRVGLVDVPLGFPCDRFDEWQDNVRAVALSLEALRLVDRYGVTRMSEQYRGFAQLPAPERSDGAMDVHEAAKFVSGLSKFPPLEILTRPDSAKEAVRQAMANAHPDIGGSTESFQKVQQAKTLLSQHHGGAL